MSTAWNQDVAKLLLCYILRSLLQISHRTKRRNYILLCFHLRHHLKSSFIFYNSGGYASLSSSERVFGNGTYTDILCLKLGNALD